MACICIIEVGRLRGAGESYQPAYLGSTTIPFTDVTRCCDHSQHRRVLLDDRSRDASCSCSNDDWQRLKVSYWRARIHTARLVVSASSRRSLWGSIATTRVLITRQDLGARYLTT